MLQAKIKKSLVSGAVHGLLIDVEFTASQGITVLFGPSGAGKTTILRTIAGIVTPDEGRIVLDDRVFFDSASRFSLPIQKRRVGYVFQDQSLFPHMTAEQNVFYGADGPGRQLTSDQIRSLLSMLAIEKIGSRYPSELSGGERQRVALARALASNPLIMLLDEPLSAIDVAARTRLLEEISAVQRQSGIPFIYVTHNHGEAARIGDYMLVLDEGKILQQGKPLEVLNSPKTVATARAVGTENLFVGTVQLHKVDEGLTSIELGGCRIDASYNGIDEGSRVMVGIRSEDILIAREHLTQTSARNVLEGSIIKIIRETDKAELVVRCGVDFKVGITPVTIRALDLAVGTRIYMLIKARAIHILA